MIHGLLDKHLRGVVALRGALLVGRIAPMFPLLGAAGAGCCGGADRDDWHDVLLLKPRRADWRSEARALKPNFFR
jgi:hypothetical protein